MDEAVQRREEDREVGLLDYWRAVWKRRWLIAALSALSLLVAFLYSLTLPKIYVATATILVQPEFPGGGGLVNFSVPSPSGGGGRSEGGSSGGGGVGLDLSGAAQLLGLNLSGPPSSQNLYLAFLKSRTMREEVVQHFRETLGPGAGFLVGPPQVSISKEDVLTVSVQSPDPKVAAAAANVYLENVQKMIARRAKTQKETEYRYYLEQIDQVKKELNGAQNNLIQFQEKNRTLALAPGIKSQIDAAAMSAGSVLALEIQREMKRMYLTEQHPEMIALNRQIYELKRLVSHSLYGEPQDLPPESAKAPPRKEFFVAAAKMTPLYFRMAEVYRDFKIKEALYNFLAQNIETHRYMKDPPPKPLDWLDPAVPPGGPTGPNVQKITSVAGLGGLVIGIFLAFFLEYIERVKGPNRSQVPEPLRPGRRFVPVPDLADGPLAAEIGNGPVYPGHTAEDVTSVPERRRPSAEPVVQSSEGRRFL